MQKCSLAPGSRWRLQLRTYTVPNCSLGTRGGERLQKCTAKPAPPPSMPGLVDGAVRFVNRPGQPGARLT